MCRICREAVVGLGERVLDKPEQARGWSRRWETRPKDSGNGRQAVVTGRRSKQSDERDKERIGRDEGVEGREAEVNVRYSSREVGGGGLQCPGRWRNEPGRSGRAPARGQHSAEAPRAGSASNFAHLPRFSISHWYCCTCTYSNVRCSYSAPTPCRRTPLCTTFRFQNQRDSGRTHQRPIYLLTAPT